MSRIAIAARKAFGTAPDDTNHGHIETNIVHTIADRNNVKGSTIRATIARIESDTYSKARKAWERIFPAEEPAGFFIAKVDVSEIPLDELQEALPTFERLLLAQGNGIYSIDCIQDFSGTLDQEALVSFLRKEQGFRDKGSFATTIGEETLTTELN